MRTIRNSSRNRRWLRRSLLAFAVLVGLLCLLPYLVPVSAASSQTIGPYENSAFLSVGGISLHYRSWSPQHASAAEPTDPSKAAAAGRVLLVHGLGGSTASWSENVNALQAAGFWTVAVDLPGFGYSTRQTGLDHSQASRARLLWAFLDALEDSGTAVVNETANAGWNLVGHSMGGGTAVAMALAQPERTAALVLVDGAVFDNAPGTASVLLRFPPTARWLQVLLERVLVTPQRVAGILESASGQTVPAERVDAYYRALAVSGTARALTDLVRTARNEPVDGLNRTDLPVRAIWGGADTWVPLARAEQLRQIVPRLELSVIPDAGHVPMETHASTFNPILLRCLVRPEPR